MQKTIVFFSSTFPSELSIEKELIILNDVFSRVIYIPINYQQKPIKQNQSLINVEYKFFITPERLKWNMFSISELCMALSIIFLYNQSLKELIQTLLNLKKYLYILKRNLFYARKIEDIIIKENLNDAVFYDYWFENVTTALGILKKKKIINGFVSRAHGFDVYDFRWGKKMHVPFRGFKINYIDNVYCISSDGQNYFKNKVLKKHHKKIRVSYAGVDVSLNELNNLSPANTFVLVSASHTADFKRVHLIPELIKEISIPMHWVHFGSGANDELIKSKVANLPNNITVSLLGKVDNEEIIRFYNSTYVDAFISLSQTEGLPISMMECAIFGIPIFACDVGGIKDIVTNETGMLINADLEIKKMREKFSEFVKKDFNRNFIQEEAKRKFDFKKNYTELFNQFKKQK
jgi:glycosyltransferase involved in cell wall biosynthesis